jgi:hypothetical protein
MLMMILLPGARELNNNMSPEISFTQPHLMGAMQPDN